MVEHKLGVIVDSSAEFWMHNRNCRAPDIPFISKQRQRGLKRPAREFFQGAPVLAVEIISPSNSSTEITERLNDFFGSGTRLAWIIHPVERFVEVCAAPTARQLVNKEGTLDGGDVVPGFSRQIAKLFEPWDWD